MYNSLLYEVNGPIARITFNRPDSFNAFSVEMAREFLDALKKVEAKRDVRVVVVAGAGEKAFCSGQDLKDGNWMGMSPSDIVDNYYNPIGRTILSMEKLVISQVNGAAAGAGAGVVLASDFAVMADDAYLLMAFVNIGLILDTGVSYTLPRIVGRKKAMELVCLGERIPAAECLRLGMINKVVSQAELRAATDELALRLSEKAPVSIKYLKKLVDASHHSSPTEMLELERQYQQICGTSDDFFEAVMAFSQKRKPEFKGK